MTKEMIDSLLDAFLMTYPAPYHDTGRMIAVVGAQRDSDEAYPRTPEKIEEEKQAIRDAVDENLMELGSHITDDKSVRINAGRDILQHKAVGLYEEDFLYYKGNYGHLASITDVENGVFYSTEHILEVYKSDIDSRPAYIADVLLSGLSNHEYRLEELFLSVHYWERSNYYQWRSQVINVHEFLSTMMTQQDN